MVSCVLEHLIQPLYDWVHIVITMPKISTIRKPRKQYRQRDSDPIKFTRSECVSGADLAQVGGILCKRMNILLNCARPLHSSRKCTHMVDVNVEKPFPTNSFPRVQISMSWAITQNSKATPSKCEGSPTALSTPLSFQVSLRSCVENT